LTWKHTCCKIVEPADGRVPPSIKPHHAAVALILIGREQPLGRYELTEQMSIGEGSTRTLLKRLTESGFIIADGKQGQRLSDQGMKIFNEISKDVPRGMFLDVPRLVVYEHAYANLVKQKANLIHDGVRQRDEAIIQGGYGISGASTLVRKNGRLVMPPEDYHILPEYSEETILIIESLKPEDEDVVILGSSEDRNLAREVAMAAVMTLFDGE
jgi:predicted transcriptional regulator